MQNKLSQLNVFSLPLNRTTGLSLTKLLMFMTLEKKEEKNATTAATWLFMHVYRVRAKTAKMSVRRE